MADEIGPEVRALLRQAGDAYGAGQIPKGIEIATQALALARREGEEHLDVAECVEALGVLHRALGDLASALPFLQEALSIREKALGDDNAIVARSMMNVGLLHQAMGDLALAEPLLRRTLEICRKALGDDHLVVAAASHNLGFLLQATGKYAEAEALLQRAIAIRREKLGSDHLDVALTLACLGLLYRDTGDLAAAEPVLKEALSIREKRLGDAHVDVAASLDDLGLLYREVGNYAAAEPLISRSLAMARRVLGEDHPYVATPLNSLALLYRDLGDFAAAEPLLEKALQIRRSRLGEDHLDVAQSLNNLGFLHEDLGDYASAEPLFERALAIFRGRLGEGHPLVATTLNNLGLLYRAMGNAAAALSFFQQSLEIRRKWLGEAHVDVAQSLNNLGTVYEDSGDYASAEPLVQKALEIFEKTLGNDHPLVAVALNNLGFLRQAMRDYAAAEPLLQKALEIRRRRLGEAHVDVAESLGNLGVLYASRGDYAAAEPPLREALAIWRKGLGEDHPRVANALRNIAGLQLFADRPGEALATLKELLPVEDRCLQQVFAIGSESRRAAFLRSVGATHRVLFSLVTHALPGDPEAARAALDYVLRHKAIKSEALGVQRDLVLGGRYEGLAPKLHELSVLRAQIASRLLAGPGKDGLEAHQQTLSAWRSRYEALDAELVRQIPEMRLGKTLEDATRAAVAAALPEGSTLIELICFTEWARPSASPPGSRYIALLLHAGAPDDVGLVDLGDAASIDALLAAFRGALTGARERRDFASQAEALAASSTSQGEALRAAVFDPLVPALGGSRRLFIVPDGEISRLPFEVLPSAEGKNLLDDYAVSYLTAGRDALRFAVRSSLPASDPLVVADPDFDLRAAADAAAPEALSGAGPRSMESDRGALHFARLSGIEEEGRAVARKLGVTPWLGGDALEGRLKRVRSPRILHVATHGFFLANQADPRGGGPALDDAVGRLLAAGRENPLLRSGLALAGANTWLAGAPLPAEAEDGLLQGADVAALDLYATELVVLSACETGLGKVERGEGVLGLGRAFVLAGARTLIMSLWKVPDRETKLLMEALYDGLSSGLGAAEALRQAQKKVREEQPDPYYWGAFVCQGDP